MMAWRGAQFLQSGRLAIGYLQRGYAATCLGTNFHGNKLSSSLLLPCRQLSVTTRLAGRFRMQRLGRGTSQQNGKYDKPAGIGEQQKTAAKAVKNKSHFKSSFASKSVSKPGGRTGNFTSKATLDGDDGDSMAARQSPSSDNFDVDREDDNEEDLQSEEDSDSDYVVEEEDSAMDTNDEKDAFDSLVKQRRGETKKIYGRLDDSSIARLANALHSKKERAKKGHCLIEGLRNIKDAFSAGYVPKAMLVERRVGDDAMAKVRAHSVPKKRQLEVSKAEMKTLCRTESPQPLAAILYVPDIKDICDSAEGPVDTNTRERDWIKQGEFLRWAWVTDKKQLDCYVPQMPLVLVCDGVRDPSNMGVLLLSAAAAGCQLVVCINGCTDVWNPKVVRAAAGAHLRMPVLNGVSWDFLREICSPERKVFLAYHSLEAMKPAGMTLLPTDRLQGMRQFLRRLPKQLYHDTIWRCDAGGILIVGGTDTGLSLNAVDFAQRYASQQVCLPVSEGVAPLSVATSSSIILFSALAKYEKLRMSEG